ncbi:MAG TPA: 3-hydroxyacyl-CoA dehydrogenase NAD-binding domain-containing protein [Candidatus Acidoferrum sp.]|nr:3-hydroxyacyl-CoA dehydrogenase NAD-binding domain-containing protein [Candidatus Acidoferrum sp.]
MDVKTIAVIGAGTMGRGIAYAAAFGGYKTVLEDISMGVLEHATAWIRQSFEEGVSRGRVEAGVRDQALSLISTTTDVKDAIRDAELIIEAVPEELKMKVELFRTFDGFAKTGAIFASNTSSLSVTDFTNSTLARDRCIGMHFFNPVPKMKLIELVRTPHTSGQTVAACREVARRMGKEVVLVNEAPGFITTRVNALIGNEAFNMLEAGIASAEDIDKALKLGLNHPMGPFELVDLVGLDVRLNILEYLHSTLGEKYRPNELLRQFVKEGRLGRKTGRGIYEYPQQKVAGKKG